MFLKKKSLRVFSASPGPRGEDFIRIAGEKIHASPVSSSVFKSLVLDTVDGRLAAAGHAMFLRDGKIHIRNLSSHGDASLVSPWDGETPSRLASDLGGVMQKKLLSKIIGGGRLAAIWRLTERTTVFQSAMPDGDGFSFEFRRFSFSRPVGDGCKTKASLVTWSGLAQDASSKLEAMALENGFKETPEASPDNPFRFLKSTPADGPRDRFLSAARTLTARMEEDICGIIADKESGPLHDFRISSRRIRSFLDCLDSLGGPGRAKFFRKGLSKMMETTNKLRDLDVLLEREPVYRSGLDKSLRRGMDECFELVRKKRAKEFGRVRDALASKEFDSLLARWDSAISGDASGVIPALDGAEMAALVSQKSRKVSSMCRDCALFPDDKSLHRLRIQVKKLRYLMDAVGPSASFPDAAALKDMQSLLGGHNDLKMESRLFDRLMKKASSRKESAPLLDALAAMSEVMSKEKTALLAKIIPSLKNFSASAESQ